MAFVDQPNLVPANPVAGQTVSVSIRAGLCDAIVSEPGYPLVTQRGNTIRVLVASIHKTGYCSFPTLTVTSPVGTYPAGSYTLQVDRIYTDASGQSVIETLGVLPMEVRASGTAAIPVPALGPSGFAVLIAALLIIALCASRCGHASSRGLSSGNASPASRSGKSG